MEAKDTMMSESEMHKAGWVNAEFKDTPNGVVCDEIYDIRKILLAQAEISFRAGYEQGQNDAWDEQQHDRDREEIPDGC